MWILLGVRKVPWLSGEAFYHSAEKLISQCYGPVFDLLIICTEKENVIQSFEIYFLVDPEPFFFFFFKFRIWELK